MAERKHLIERLKEIEAARQQLDAEEEMAFIDAKGDEIEEYFSEEYLAQLASQPAPAPRRMLTIEVDTEDHALSDPSSPPSIKEVPRMRFEVDLEAMTKTVSRAVTQIVKRANSQGLFSSQPSNALTEVLSSMTRELPTSLRAEVFRAVKRARRKAYEKAVQKTYGVLHRTHVEPSVTKKPRLGMWSSPEELRAALYRAVEAIEYRDWHPKNTKMKARLVRKRNRNKAEWEIVVAYWKEEEKRYVIDDSKAIDRWLKKADLPNFSQLREALRKEIEAERESFQVIETIFNSLP
jgi:hypothetical protein